MVVLADDMTAVKDPMIAYSGGRWYMWVCCHPCTVPPEADQAYTSSATSHDGIEWSWHGTALAPRAGAWDARMARVTAVLTDGPQPVAYYDGRATAAENCEERLGLALGDGLGSFRAVDGGPFAASPCASGGLRYLAVVRTGDGGHRIYFEAAREDGAHELRVEGSHGRADPGRTRSSVPPLRGPRPPAPRWPASPRR